jgi:hypothetical protein
MQPPALPPFFIITSAPLEVVTIPIMARTNKTTRKSTPPHIRASRPSKLNLGKVAKATPKAPKIKNFWYKSNMISDITIVYGKHGEKRFKDHRFVLCNSSDWFIGASSHPLFVSTLCSFLFESMVDIIPSRKLMSAPSLSKKTTLRLSRHSSSTHTRATIIPPALE